MNKLKEFFMKEKENQVIRKDNLLILVLAGILLLVVCLPVKSGKPGDTQSMNQANLLSGSEGEDTQITDNTTVSVQDSQDYIAVMEQKLENLLKCMEGVGNARVMITLKTSEEQVVEKDIPNSRSNLTETDSQGGARSSNEMENTETTVYLTNSDGEKIPYVIKKMEPVVDGVVVIAQGGGNAECCKNITEVIQALFGIEPHKIKVVKMKTK